MNKSKKILSLALSAVMAFSVSAIGLTAIAAPNSDGTDILPPLVEDGGIDILPPIVDEGEKYVVGWNEIDGEWYLYDGNLNMVTEKSYI